MDKPVKLTDQVRAGVRCKYYAPSTERVYRFWIRRYILYHGKNHPKDLGGRGVVSPADVSA